MQVAFKQGFLPLRRQGADKIMAGVIQAQATQMDLGLPALELHQGLPEVKGPAIRRGIGLGNVAVRNGVLKSTHCAPHGALGARKAILFPQPLKNPLSGMPLFGGPPLVLLQPPLDYLLKRTDGNLGSRLASAVDRYPWVI